MGSEQDVTTTTTTTTCIQVNERERDSHTNQAYSSLYALLFNIAYIIYY